MCRIASIFLLQRLKGSMLGDARDFNNMETRAVIKIFFPARQCTEGNSRHSDRNIRGTCTIVLPPSKTGWSSLNVVISTCGAPGPGRPKTVTTPEIIDQIHDLILEGSLISAKSIAEQMGISRERVGSIIREDLNMRKLSTKWVP